MSTLCSFILSVSLFVPTGPEKPIRRVVYQDIYLFIYLIYLFCFSCVSKVNEDVRDISCLFADAT